MAESADEAFDAVSQKMKAISQSFASEKMDRTSHTAEENIQAYTRYKDWLQTLQQMQLGVSHSMSDLTSSPSHQTDIEDIHSRVALLQQEIFSVSMTHGVKELIVRSAQLGSRLQELLFPSHEDAAADTTKWARDQCKRQTVLSSDILAHHHACQQVQHEIDQIKKEITALQVSNAELMTRLQSVEDQQQSKLTSSKHIQHQQEKLDGILSHITMERGILQGLVIGSGINWAKDDTLKEIVIELGKPLQLD